MARKRQVRKICVIRLSSLGDVIQASASIRALKDAYPEAKLTFVVAKGFEDPILECPIIDDLIIYDRGGKNLNNFPNFLGLINRLFRERFDLLIDLHMNRRTRILSFFALPRRRTPVIGNYSNIPNLIRHEYFLNRLGVTGSLPPMESWVGEKNIEFARKFLERAGVGPDDLVVGLNAGVNWTSKQWPNEYYVDVGNYFHLNYGAKTIVFGGPDDREKALEIYKGMISKPMLAAGRTSFLEAGALINRCNLFITGDTGLMHMARGLKVPSVVIFGGTDPRMHTDPLPSFMRVLRDGKCLPPCYKFHCPLKTRACLWAMEPKTVIEEAEDLLGIKKLTAEEE